MTTDDRTEGGFTPFVSDLELKQKLDGQPVGELATPISASDALAGAKTSPFGSDMELAVRLKEQEKLKGDSSV